jgi:hypothetical protein
VHVRPAGVSGVAVDCRWDIRFVAPKGILLQPSFWASRRIRRTWQRRLDRKRYTAYCAT